MRPKSSVVVEDTLRPRVTVAPADPETEVESPPLSEALTVKPDVAVLALLVLSPAIGKSAPTRTAIEVRVEPLPPKPFDNVRVTELDGPPLTPRAVAVMLFSTPPRPLTPAAVMVMVTDLLLQLLEVQVRVTMPALPTPVLVRTPAPLTFVTFPLVSNLKVVTPLASAMTLPMLAFCVTEDERAFAA